MRFARYLAVLVLLAVAPSAAAEEWTILESPNFVIYSADPATAHRLADDVEQLRGALREAGLVPANDVLKTRIVVFRTRRDAQPYFDLLLKKEKANAAAVYVGLRHSRTLLLIGSNRDRSRSAYHELLHDLVNSGNAPIPRWLDEGVAEYFSRFVAARNALLFGQLHPSYLRTLSRRRMSRTSDLHAVRADSDVYRLRGLQEMFYAQSWATVHALMSSHPKPVSALRALVEQLAGGIDPDDALQQAFGLSSADLDRMLRVYATPRQLRPVKVVVPNRLAPGGRISRPATEAALRAQLAEVLLGALPDNLEAARREAERALALEPANARALATIAEIELTRVSLGAALQLVQEAISEAGDDAEVALRLAQTLIERALGPMPQPFELNEIQRRMLSAADSALQRAAQLAPDDPRVLACRGIVAITHDGDAANALQLLERASTDSGDHDLIAFRYAAMLKQGDAAGADVLYRSAVEGRDPRVLAGVRSVRVDWERSRANQLFRSGDPSAAAEIIERLAAETTDAAARAELLKHAEDLRRIAAAQRETALYNEAVAAANGGALREADEILSRLLATATDARVISSARALQADIRERMNR